MVREVVGCEWGGGKSRDESVEPRSKKCRLLPVGLHDTVNSRATVFGHGRSQRLRLYQKRERFFK